MCDVFHMVLCCDAAPALQTKLSLSRRACVEYIIRGPARLLRFLCLLMDNTAVFWFAGKSIYNFSQILNVTYMRQKIDV